MQIWEREVLPAGLDYFGYCLFDCATERLDWHGHDGMEIIVLVKGIDYYTLEQQTYEIHGGEAFIVRPQQIHASGKAHQGIGEYLWFQLDLNCQDSFLGLSEQNSRFLLAGLARIDAPIIKVGPKNIQILKNCYKNLIEKNYFLVENQMASFLYQIIFAHSEKKQPDLVDQVQAYLDASLSEPLKAEEIARHFYISVSTLQHSFYQKTGQTLVDYINFRRIEKAKQLLSRGHAVTETAMMVGYGTVNYFATIFKRYTLVTPSQFKNNKKEEKKCLGV